MTFVDGDLRVVGCTKPAITHHDPAVGIREVSLALGLGVPTHPPAASSVQVAIDSRRLGGVVVEIRRP